MYAAQQANKLTLRKLRQRWAVFLALCILALFGGYLVLRAAWQPVYALRWLVLAAPVLSYLLVVLWRGLPDNHRPGESALLPGFGWGNRLTLLRGVLLAGLAGFLFAPQPPGWLIWAPGSLYTLADAADFFDGYLARRTNHATRLGEILDMSFDGLGVLIAAALAAQYGQVPVWYLLVALARYLFVAGIALRRRLGKPVYDLPPSAARRILAGLQMGFIAVMLWPLFTPPATHLAAALFGLPFLAGFTRDWLYASGVLRPPSPLGKGGGGEGLASLQRWLPLALRLVILALGGVMLLQSFQDRPVQDVNFLLLIGVETIVVLLLALGVGSRITAIAALCLLGFHQMFASLTPLQIILAAAYAAILFMGSGPYALWTPEEYLFHHRAGEKHPPLPAPPKNGGFYRP